MSYSRERCHISPFLSLLISALFVPMLGAKHSLKNNDDEAPAALPADPNSASLRVASTLALYELDASPEQIKAVRAAGSGAAAVRARTPARGAAKLGPAMAELESALLAGKDDATIAQKRNALVDAAAADDVQLDDQISPTTAARSKAPAVAKTFRASQLAAYLAAHADEVGDPVERMVSALADAHDPDAAAEQQDAAEEVAELVCGIDDASRKLVADKVAAWLKAHDNVGEDDLARDQTSLEDSARKAIGDVSPVVVLGHWFDREVAMLLSNPQMPAAADALLAARSKGN